MTKTTTTTTTVAETAEEIRMKNFKETGIINACNRCGRQLQSSHRRHTVYDIPVPSHNEIRTLTLRLPPEEGKARYREFGFYMCHWCVTAFLKFMQEKEKKKKI